MKLRLLSPDDVYAGWDWLRNGIIHCQRKTDARYRPEDIYLRLRASTAWAYAIEHNGDDIGFAVLTQEFDPDGLVLFVWVIWCEPGGAIGVHRDIFAELETMARSIKAKRIRMHSPRKGWEKARYFTPVTIVYEHEVML